MDAIAVTSRSHARARAPGPGLKSFRVPGGPALQFVEQGDPAGVPVVMLHGITDSWRSFEPVLPHLPSSIRALALTQRGHGDSERPAAGYRTRDFGQDVIALLDELRIESAIVVGHSMGSTNAMRFAIDHPRRARGLVLVGAFASYRRNAPLVEFFDTMVGPLVDPIDPAFAREFQESTLAQPIPPAFLDAAVAESMKAPARVWRNAFAGLFEDDFTDELGAIAAPTLLVWGARDAFVPRSDQDALVAGIRGAELKVYQRAGHAVHWEEPARFASDLQSFVSMASAQTE